MKQKPKVEGPCVYQLKLILDHIEPPIWRRVLVEGDETLGGLHGVIQVVMGWEDCHLHEFGIEGASYGLQDAGFLSHIRDEEAYTLKGVLAGKHSRFTYLYDFGDSWTITGLVEKVLPVDPDKEYPVCVAGARSGPPEDSGGVFGYELKLKALRNPDDPEHDEIVAWMGADWDPEHFDLDSVNAGLDPSIYDEPMSEEEFDSLGEEEQDALIESMLEEDPFLEERVARLNAKIASVHGLDSPEAVRAFVEATAPGALKDFAMEHMASDPVEAAFEFGLLALETGSRSEGQQFADRALELDARNVDGRIAKAHHLLADEKLPEGIVLLREALAVAEENLGPGYIDAHRGAFSEFVETRPYVRARVSLARALRFDGQVDEAINHLEALLELDTDDYIGARFSLVGMLLQARQLEKARSVLDRYGSVPDPDPVLVWGRVLERYLSGDLEGAEAALETALEVNPLAGVGLLSVEALDGVDESTESGIATLMCAEYFGEAWEGTDGALEWLAAFIWEDSDGE